MISETITNALAWAAIAVFLVGATLSWGERVAERRRPGLGTRFVLGARYVSVVAWILFGAFWLLLSPSFYYDAHSPIQTLLSLAALPLCWYTGYLLARGRDSLLVLSKAIAIMGLIYLPAETIPFVRQWLIETVAIQTHAGMELLGHSPGLTEGQNGYQSEFAFEGYTTYIILACTGIGSISIFGGLIAAVSAPLRQKLLAFALAVGIIWILNLVRNVFVGLATPLGWFQQAPFVHFTTEYLDQPAHYTSYFISHTVISQSLSVVALVGITYIVVRVVPEVMVVIEEVLYVATGSEYDLQDALGTRVRADGGENVLKR